MYTLAYVRKKFGNQYVEQIKFCKIIAGLMWNCCHDLITSDISSLPPGGDFMYLARPNPWIFSNSQRNLQERRNQL